MAGVPNPHSSAATLPKPIGTQTFTSPGTFTVTPPSGTRCVLMTLRGAGGAGGGGTSNGSGGAYEGGTGGNGALQRRIVRCSSSPFQVTVGLGGLGGLKGGTGGLPSTPTTALGFTALAGTSGTSAFGGGTDGSPGAGTDGPEPIMGYGNFQGAPTIHLLWTSDGRRASAPGTGGYSGGGGGNGSGNNGGDGYAYFEFFA